MDDSCNLGPVNGHIVGRVLKEAVRRATVVIRNERAIFETLAKEDAYGRMDDVLTSADRKAQDIYMRTLQECFPRCGVVAEEDSLRIEASQGCTAWFTVDPLDGTKAYIRRQSHGVGTMIALIDKGEIISAYVGDVNTEETYGYRPGSTRAHRITRRESFEEMTFHNPYSPDAYILLRDPKDRYSPLSRNLVERRFKSYLVDGASIGIWLARLWKREVSAALLPPNFETPWDSAPVIGISLKLGYVFMKPNDEATGWIPYTPKILPEKYRRDHDLLVIHQDDVAAALA